MAKAQQLALEEYQIGWICALHSEMTAAIAMLDQRHGKPKRESQDRNCYELGRIHNHNVVIACLPDGIYGTAPAATVAANMLRTFKSLKVGLMVGIGGGIPFLEKRIDIRLGDIVVGRPTETNGGVVQYDRGTNVQDDGFIQKGSLNAPPETLLTALSSLRAEHGLSDSLVPTYLSEMVKKYPKMKDEGYAFPGMAEDRLYTAGYPHIGSSDTCKHCEAAQMIDRKDRSGTRPRIHYGCIASGNQVIRNAFERDLLRDNFGAVCVETEAAGLMNDFPCLVIRGICDYADSHKNDIWQKYAAASAAAFAKELLLFISSNEVRHEQSISGEWTQS